MSNPNIAAFPYAPSTDLILAVASDNASTKLVSDIQSTDLTFAVADASSFSTPCLVVIGSEILRIKSTSGNTMTCDRGFSNTVAAVHFANSPVTGTILSYHHNQLVVEVEKMSCFLFNNLSGFKKNENLLLYSELFSNAYWITSSGVTVTAGGPNLVNGSPSFLLTEGNTLGPNMIAATPNNLVVGSQYTMSVYAKYTNNQWLAVGQHIDGTEGNVVWFDILNGVVGNLGSAAKGAIIGVGNGWYRCLAVFNATNNVYQNMNIALASTNGTVDYVGTGTKTAYIAAAQVRSGGLDGPHTYIRTSGTTFSINGSGDLVLDEGDLT